MNSERTAFLLAIATILLAALIVAPAAARTISSNGADVYVGEEDLGFTYNVPVGETVTQWVHYYDITAGNVDRIISATADGNISELAGGIPTGTYYVFTAAGDPANRSTAAGYVNVLVPDATLDVVLNTSQRDSVNGKTVTRDALLDFKVMNNLNGLPGAVMNIEVTLPGGGVTTEFGGQALSGIPVDGTTRYVGTVNLTDVSGGTYTAQAKWPAGSDFYDKGYDSNTVTFEVATRALGITSSKETITRSNDIVVTVTGEPKKEYRLFIREVPTLVPGQYPQIVPGQNGVITTHDETNVTIMTTASGTRSTVFNTNVSTADLTYTFRVEDPADAAIYDDARVRVEKGAVTATVSGTGVYYRGEDIVISGTNTDNDITYLFVTGPNLPPRGIRFEDLYTRVIGAKVQTGNESTFTRVAVDTDDTWTYRWETSRVYAILDAGGYTIYAASCPVDKDDLSDAQYDTVSIQLRSPSVTATASSAAVAKGDDLTITGTAAGDPANVCIWVFGRYYSRYQQPLSVGADGAFEYTIESSDTSAMGSGQHFVVVQHPMDDVFDVWVSGTTLTGNGITPINLATLQPSEAANALIDALDSPDIDDIYAKLTFTVEEPRILIDPIDDQTTGSVFTISGTTNLAVGDKLNIEVISSSFQPSTKTETTGFSNVAGTAVVQAGDGANTWSFEVDATGFTPDQYIVTVESIDTDTVVTATFNVIEGHVTPPYDQNLTLAPGWNFVSVPRPLAAGNDTATIFAAVDTGGRSALRYNATAGQWAALAATDRIAPLEGFWIYSAGSAAVPLNFSTDLPIPPSERSLGKGWNAVGVTGTAPATARDTLYSVNGQWTTLIGFNATTQAFETAVVNGGSGAYADSRSVNPGRGYWLYMTGPGTLCSLGA